MNGGIAPFLLLATTAGLMFGLARLFLALLGTTAFVAAAVVGWILPGLFSEAILFSGLFVAMLALAAAVYFPFAQSVTWVMFLGVNGGLWLGACAAAIGLPGGLAIAPLAVLSAAVARWTVQRRLIIIVKVAASWMIAIASLALFVSLLPTPGYQPDHME